MLLKEQIALIKETDSKLESAIKEFYEKDKEYNVESLLLNGNVLNIV